MRCTQIIGLRKEAEEFLEKWCSKITDKWCPSCGTAVHQVRSAKIYYDAGEEGMFEDGPQLMEYDLINGTKVREIVQASPWSSGPCIFLCLETEDKVRLFEWSQEDINNA